MNLRIVFAILMIGYPAQSQAMEMDFEIESINIFEGESTTHKKMKSGNHKHGCTELGFSNQQKKMYREVQSVFVKQTLELKENYKEAKKKYFSYIRRPNQKIKMVTLLQDRLTELRTELEEARADFFHFVLNEVAHPNQRREFLKCLHHMRHHRRVKELRIHEKKHREFHRNAENRSH